jgi:hypothetical protein
VVRAAAGNPGGIESLIPLPRAPGIEADPEDGTKVLIVDEWPDRESFESFAEEQAPQIEPMFKAANGTEISEPTYWRELTTYDAFGWGT